MTKMLIEVPDQMHKIIKSIAMVNHESVKSLMLRGVSKIIKEETKIDINHLSEQQVDKLLKPLIKKYIKQLNEGNEQTYGKKEFFEKLKK